MSPRCTFNSYIRALIFRTEDVNLIFIADIRMAVLMDNNLHRCRHRRICCSVPMTEKGKGGNPGLPLKWKEITDRPGQFHYKEAEEKGLPVGSGEIESAHRCIVRNHLKIPGAWRKENNAQNMLSLRVPRADGDWESYRKKSWSGMKS